MFIDGALDFPLLASYTLSTFISTP